MVGVSLVVFFVIRLSGDPTFLLLSADATEADRVRFAREQGFDRPVYVQYAVFVKRAVQGDLGRSLRYRQPALPLVLERLPATLELARPRWPSRSSWPFPPAWSPRCAATPRSTT